MNTTTTAQLKKRYRMALVSGLFFTLFAHSAWSGSGVEMELPLIVNKAVSGEITANLATVTRAGAEHTSVTVLVGRLRELLTPYANHEQLDAWIAGDSDENMLSLNDLRTRGLDINFDSGMLEISAIVPRLGTQAISIRGRKKPVLANHYEQAKFASGFNYRLSNRYSHQDSGQKTAGFEGLKADLSGYTSIGGFGGWSLFYEAEYDASEEHKLARKDVTLIHDSYSSGLRYSIGDFRPSVSRFQSSPDLLGINIERDYAEINPFRNLRPSGNSTFTLERDSRVTFEVNGAIVSTEDLPQGTYAISDFPLVSGGNDVRVYVDDGISSVEVANFSTYVDTTLLSAGITNFGVSLGVQREQGAIGRREYGDELRLLGFYEKGLSSNLTLGAQVEVAEDHALVSSAGVFGTRLGVFALEAAVSKRDGHGTGTAAILRYDFGGINKANWSVQNDFQLRYRSDNFISLGDTATRPEEWMVNARSSFAKAGSSYSLGAELASNDDLLTSRLNASMSRRFGNYSLALSYQYQSIEDGENDNRVTLTLLRSFSASKVRGQYKSHSQEFRADWSTDAARGVGSYRANISTVTSPELTSSALTSSYIGSRFEAGVRHRSNMPKAEGREDTHATTLSLSGGLGIADGAFAYGRPSNRGFMIVDRHKTLNGKDVQITRSSERGDMVTKITRGKTTLVPLSNTYRSQRFVFSVDDLPTGYDIGSGDVKLYPGHLAGFRYKLGSDAANTIIGKLYWPDGTALNLTSGRLFSVDGKTEAPIFTNRTGRFVAEKLRFGKYRMVFGDNQQFEAMFEVAEGDEPGLVQVGKITLVEKP